MDQVEQKDKQGIVNIDGVYAFKVDKDCYVFGKLKVDENEKDCTIQSPLYPTTINGVFNLYFRHKLSDMSMNKRMEINELLDVVNEVKRIIKDIQELLSYEDMLL